jgi:hypothetical protein
MTPADPTAAAATAASAGIGALILTTLGVEPQTLLWAGIGASVGVTAAPQASRARAVFTFAAVVLLSALFGTYIAHEHLAGSALARNFCSAVIGGLFHPLFSAAIAGVPSLVTKLTDLIGGAR